MRGAHSLVSLPAPLIFSVVQIDVFVLKDGLRVFHCSMHLWVGAKRTPKHLEREILGRMLGHRTRRPPDNVRNLEGRGILAVP